jgi:dTDP-4-dehydrorhamnose 3,5-epimerase-like enzyme
MNEIPTIIKGDFFEDERGRLEFINSFKLDSVKRIYFIENSDSIKFRGWQGHKIEKRWFFCIRGAFEISVVKIDNWNKPNKNLEVSKFILEEKKPNILFIPNGYANGLSSIKKGSRLMALSDYALGVHNDEFKFKNSLWR